MKIFGTLVLVLFLSCQFALAQDTLYVYRAGVVVTKRATSEIDSVTFKKNYNTPATGNVTDMDGNVYHSVTIGAQTWMVENLKTTKYNDGTAISLISDGYQWSNTTTPGCCWVNNDATYKNTYGALYNWYAVNTGKLAPVGWHIPSQTEINALASYLGGYSVAGSKLKESGNVHWVSLNSDATNSSGFTALPGGYRSSASGDYHNSGIWCVFWASNEVQANGGRYMLSNESPGFDYNSDGKMSGFSVRCIKDSVILPTLTTSPVSAVTDSTATGGGNITADGGAPVTSRGVCWSTKTNPTVANNKTTDGTGTGVFMSSITGLKVDSTYYVRGYATNCAGTAYGSEIPFTVSKTVLDLDGNAYHTVEIGTQTWMVENLKTTRFNDGTLIPLVTDNVSWANLLTPGYCYYANDSITYHKTFGALYNWYAVNTGKLAPTGWHVATDEEWTNLTTYLGGESTAGGKMKETGYNHWISPNTGATNENGFTGLSGGLRSYSDGTFRNTGSNGYFWSITQSDELRAWDRELFYNQENCFRNNTDSKHYGFSVRCVKDALIKTSKRF